MRDITIIILIYINKLSNSLELSNSSLLQDDCSGDYKKCLLDLIT